MKKKNNVQNLDLKSMSITEEQKKSLNSFVQKFSMRKRLIGIN